MKNRMLKGMSAVGILTLMGAMFFATLIGGILCIERIPAGYAGIVYSINGGVTGETLSQGWKFVSPTKKVVKYPISTETMYMSRDIKEGSEGDDSFNISTKDGKLVNVDAEISYHYDIEKLPQVFKKFRGRSTDDIENTFIRARLKDIANQVSSRYAVLDVYGEKRSELNIEVYKHLKDILDDNGMELETFAFTRIEPDVETQKAINDRVNAQQKLEQMKTEKQQAEVQAEKLKVEAEGKANATLIEAEATAKANELIRNSLSSEFVEYEKIQKWNGSLPQVSGGNAIVDIRE